MLLLLLASPSLSHAEPAPSSTAAPTSPTPPAPTPPKPGYITDAECVARGGTVVTEQTYAHLDRRRDPDETPTPFRICRVPSPKNGQSCAGEADCGGGRCMCTGELGRPDPQSDPALRARAGQAATGICSDEPLPSGSWYCLVEGGKARLNGIILD